MYSQRPKAVKRYPVIDHQHPLNSTFIKTGSAQFNSLCQQDRLEPNTTIQNTYKATTLTYAIWQEVQPTIQLSQAKLLAGAGTVALKVHSLPFPLIIHIADFLYPSRDPGKSNRSKPLEWLIISALYRQIYPGTLEKADLQDNIQQTTTTQNTRVSFKKCTEATLVEDAIRTSERAVITTAEQIAFELTRENAQHLILISIVGTSAEKTETLHYLLKALYRKYCTCQLNHKLQNQAHKDSYNQTRRYFYFIKGYYETWFKTLEKIKHAENSCEYIVANDYPKYLSCAKEKLEHYKPQTETSYSRWWK